MKTIGELFGDKPEAARTNGPRNRHEYRAAAAELRSRGLSARDIARTLALTEPGVVELLREHHYATRNRR